jgi:predicted nucleic acid-binding protein
MSRAVFFDSNILIYAFTQAGNKTNTAQQILSLGGAVNVQALNETANVLRRKFIVCWPRIGQIIDAIVKACPNPLPPSLETHRAALRICERYGYSMYDGLILAAAREAGCKTLYSEDLQHGQIIEGVQIENPFLATSMP